MNVSMAVIVVAGLTIRGVFALIGYLLGPVSRRDGDQPMVSITDLPERPQLGDYHS